jgi:hypothetical protein
LCGIRICGLTPAESASQQRGDSIHGLVVCDECEAIWLDPDVKSDHVYPNPTDSACPICCQPLWGPTSRWANDEDVRALGWSDAVNHDLDMNAGEEIA